MQPPKRRPKRFSKFQLFSFVALFLVVVFALANKVSAQGEPKPKTGAGGAAAKIGPK